MRSQIMKDEENENKKEPKDGDQKGNKNEQNQMAMERQRQIDKIAPFKNKTRACDNIITEQIFVHPHTSTHLTT